MSAKKNAAVDPVSAPLAPHIAIIIVHRVRSGGRTLGMAFFLLLIRSLWRLAELGSNRKGDLDVVVKRHIVERVVLLGLPTACLGRKFV